MICISIINTNGEEITKNEILAVNWHLEAVCNYGCKFCFAPLIEQRTRTRLSSETGELILRSIAKYGVRKINFVGGEPMLNPHLEDWIIHANSLGMTTSIVSNGTGMSEGWLSEMRPYLDWIGLSIDASCDGIHAEMGRSTKREARLGESGHLSRCLEVWKNARKLGYGLKLNTVVTSANLDDDMAELVSRLKPNRWKIFRVLLIDGENDGRVEPLMISAREFAEYVERHRTNLIGRHEIQIVAEDNSDMLGTYAMIDPQGLAYTNMGGRYRYSTSSVAEVGFAEAWAEVSGGFCESGFISRGGNWDWDENPHGGFRLPILGGISND